MATISPLSDGIRQTHLSLAHRCMRQLYFYLYSGPARPNYYIANGVAGHTAIEYAMREKRHSGNLPPEGEFLDAYSTRFSEELQRCERGGRVDPAELRDRMTGVRGQAGTLPLFYRRVAPGMVPLLIEEQFKMPLPGTKVPYIGTLDIVEEDGTLTDYKFRAGARIPSQKEVNQNFQLQSYKLAAQRTKKIPITKTVQMQLRCNPKNSPDVVPMVQELAPGHLSEESIISEYKGVIRFVEKAKGDPELYPMTAPDQWWCSEEWCGWAKACPRFGGNHDTHSLREV